MKKREREPVTLKETTNILIIPIIMTITIMTTLIIVGNYNTGISLQQEAKIIVYKAQINMRTQLAMNDNFSKSIAEECGNLPSIKQPNCVIDAISPYFNYTVKEPMMIMPSTYKEIGGSCSDTTILHSSIFKLLGWKVQYIFPNQQHIYLVISKKIPCPDQEEGETCNFFCDMDGDKHICKLSY